MKKRATSQTVNCEMEKFMSRKGVRGQQSFTGRKNNEKIIEKSYKNE